MARPVVASPTCLAGVSAIPGEHLLEAATPGEWEARILELFEDGDRRRLLGESGRRFVEEHHCWEHCLEPLAGMLMSAVSTTSPVVRCESMNERVVGTREG